MLTFNSQYQLTFNLKQNDINVVKLFRCSCEKQFRCTIKRSNGTGDNVCSVYTVKGNCLIVYLID
jgi:surfactin synthase thioesterase subunit